jgi:hypothetical protein
MVSLDRLPDNRELPIPNPRLFRWTAGRQRCDLLIPGLKSMGQRYRDTPVAAGSAGRTSSAALRASSSKRNRFQTSHTPRSEMVREKRDSVQTMIHQ